MVKVKIELLLKVHHTYNEFREELHRINRELDFQQVVRVGINAIQAAQRRTAPIGTTGRGPHGRIPRSIRAARVRTQDDGSAIATSSTRYKPAIFTNEGTGLGASPARNPYFIPVPTRTAGHGRMIRTNPGFMHPGIGAARVNPFTGMGWWEEGADIGSTIAFEAFKRKVERVLRLRGL